MGRIENIVLEYLSKPEIFADLFNGYLFGGEQIIKPENLQGAEGETQLLTAESVNQKKKYTYEIIKKKRDIVREVVLGDQRVRLAVFGIEHQNEIDYSMALRVQAYDVMEYLKQVKEIQRRHQRTKDVKGKEYISGFKKEDRLIPVVTIVFYTGEEKWDAAMSLKVLLSMLVQLDIPEPEEEKEDEINMCKALEEIKQIGREEGREEGKVYAYADMGLPIVEIARKIGVSKEEVENILQKQVIF